MLTFGVHEKLGLAGIDTTRGILDSIIKLHREMGQETTGIPRWAIRARPAGTAQLSRSVERAAQGARGRG